VYLARIGANIDRGKVVRFGTVAVAY